MSALRQFRLAAGFLTRIPIGNIQASDVDFARSLGFFPLVGFLLGILLSNSAALLSPQLPAPVVACILVAVGAALTGALHLDGLADVFDGLGGAQGRPERMLEIMRDSRIGAHGATALILYLVLKVLVLAPLIEAQAFATIALMPLVARALLVPAVVLLPYARAQGLGSSFASHAGARELLLALATLTAAVTVMAPHAALPCAISFAVGSVFTALILSKLGGLTGDAYGALVEISELSFVTAILWLA